MNRRHLLKNFAIAVGAVAAKPLLADQKCAVIAPYVQQCTAGIPSGKMEHVQAYQEMPEWCWAACIQMVFTYWGHPVDQQRIVKETWGSIKNLPGQPSQILADLNRTWKDDNGKSFSSTGDSMTVNASTAVVDLQQERPLIVGALGHATVLTALTSNIAANGAWNVMAATVRDPWPGNGGRRILSPQEWYNINFAARITVSDDSSDDDDDDN